MDKCTYYMEWWTIGDKLHAPEPGTFSIKPSSLKYFIKRFINGPEKRSIVYLRNTDNQKVIVDKRSTY